jgi:small subunit ribosomal protein S10
LWAFFVFKNNMAQKGRIRVRLKSYDSRIIDSTCQQILDTAIRTGAKVNGAIRFTTKSSVVTVLK